MSAPDTPGRTRALFPLLFTLALFVAAFLYLAGIDYGLPHVFQPDEPITVNRALRFGSGDLNPHFFYYPSLLMYLYFFLYGIYFTVGYAAGLFSGVQAFAHAFITDPSPFYVIGRALSAFSLLAGMVFLYRCGERRGGRGAGLLAVLAVAFLPDVVEYAHWAKADAPLLGLSAAALALLVVIAEGGRRRDYILAGVVLGAALGLKYNAVLLFPALPLAHLLGCRGSGRGLRCLFDGRLWAAAGLVPVAFVVTTPFALLDWPKFAHDFSEQVAINVGGVAGLATGWRSVLEAALFWGTPYPIGILTGFSLAWALLRRERTDLLLAAMWIVGVAALSRQGIVDIRYLFPLYPAWALLLGRWAAGMARPGLPLPLRAAPAVAVVLSAAAVLTVSAGVTARFRATDTRIAAKAWVEENLPEGARIAVDSYGPPLELTRVELERLYEKTAELGHIKSDYYRLKLEAWSGPGYDWHLTEQSFIVTPPDLAAYSRQAQRLFPVDKGYGELARRGFEYMIAADWNYRTYLNGKGDGSLSKEGLFYRDLFEKLEPVKVFSPGTAGLAGPEISIFAVADD